VKWEEKNEDVLLLDVSAPKAIKAGKGQLRSTLKISPEYGDLEIQIPMTLYQ
jgi:hypothetical protein